MIRFNENRLGDSAHIPKTSTEKIDFDLEKKREDLRKVRLSLVDVVKCMNDLYQDPLENDKVKEIDSLNYISNLMLIHAEDTREISEISNVPKMTSAEEISDIHKRLQRINQLLRSISEYVYGLLNLKSLQLNPDFFLRLRETSDALEKTQRILEEINIK